MQTLQVRERIIRLSGRSAPPAPLADDTTVSQSRACPAMQYNKASDTHKSIISCLGKDYMAYNSMVRSQLFFNDYSFEKV